MTTDMDAADRRTLASRLPLWLHPSDIQGLAQLAKQAALGVTGIAETVQGNVYRTVAAAFGSAGARFIDHSPGSSGIKQTGVTALAYGSIKATTRLVAGVADAALSQMVARSRRRSSSPQREAMLSALNGVLGDHLLQTGNPLTIDMSLRHLGRALVLERSLVGEQLPSTTAKVMVFVHGLCMNDLQWGPSGTSASAGGDGAGCDYAVEVARAGGYTPVHLHYNSGRHTSVNGEDFAELLERLWHAWPQPISDLTLVAHSMGGLVSRAACHQAEKSGHAWRGGLKNLIFLGTPHHGAPLEVMGSWLDGVLGSNPVTRPFARIGQIRSAGITDLRYGNVVEADWQGRERFDREPDVRQPLPLPRDVACFTVAASTQAPPANASGLKVRLGNRLLGDGLVPVGSALGLHDDGIRGLQFLGERQWTVWQTGHMALLHSPVVAAQLRAWLSPSGGDKGCR